MRTGRARASVPETRRYELFGLACGAAGRVRAASERPARRRAADSIAGHSSRSAFSDGSANRPIGGRAGRPSSCSASSSRASDVAVARARERREELHQSRVHRQDEFSRRRTPACCGPVQTFESMSSSETGLPERPRPSSFESTTLRARSCSSETSRIRSTTASLCRRCCAGRFPKRRS